MGRKLKAVGTAVEGVKLDDKLDAENPLPYRPVIF
jgi:hypothetical protein